MSRGLTVGLCLGLVVAARPLHAASPSHDPLTIAIARIRIAPDPSGSSRANAAEPTTEPTTEPAAGRSPSDEADRVAKPIPPDDPPSTSSTEEPADGPTGTSAPDDDADQAANADGVEPAEADDDEADDDEADDDEADDAEPTEGPTAEPLRPLQTAAWWTMFGAFAVGTTAGVLAGLAERQEDRATRLSTLFDTSTGAQPLYADRKDEYERYLRRGQGYAQAAIGVGVASGVAAIAAITLFAIDARRQRREQPTRSRASLRPRFHPRFHPRLYGGMEVRF